MPEDPIHQPNDKLLKATFSVPENARAFFENHLPKEIAAALSVAPRTVESHLHRVFRKLGVTRRSALSKALRDHDCTATDSA